MFNNVRYGTQCSTCNKATSRKECKSCFDKRNQGQVKQRYSIDMTATS